MSMLLQLWRALINTPQTSPIFRRAFMLSRRYMQVMDVPELPPINLWEGFQKFLTRIISILGGVGFLIGVACSIALRRFAYGHIRLCLWYSLCCTNEW